MLIKTLWYICIEKIRKYIFDIKMNYNVFLQLEGNADDLLMINGDGSMKCTRLISLEPNIKPEEDEIIDICVTSTNVFQDHSKFNKLIGKKIRLTIETLEEDVQ